MSNTKESYVIAKQATELIELKARLEAIKNMAASMKLRLVCIGGPLNDNIGEYTRDQLQIFIRLLEGIEYVKETSNITTDF